MDKYIDADKLIKAMKKTAEITGRFGDAVNAFEACVKLMPAADVVEVKHGKWLPNYIELLTCEPCSNTSEVMQAGWKCSLCGRQERKREPYCNCGAKMDGGKENEQA